MGSSSSGGRLEALAAFQRVQFNASTLVAGVNTVMQQRLLKRILSCALLLIACPFSLALGPNMMANNGFEGGDQQYTLQKTFQIVHDPKLAHSGSWALTADLNQTGDHAYQTFACWPSTSYTTQIWYKGSGRLTLEILGSDWKTVLGSTALTGTSAWQQADLVWNSGSVTSAMIMLTDDLGHGTMALDDISTSLTNGQTISFDAKSPSKSAPKFQLLFDDEFDSSRTIDTANSGKSGYHWYLQSFYDPKYNASASMFTVDHGTLTFKDSGDPWSEVLDTAHPSDNSQGFIGTVFSGGHGLYAEAKIAVMNISHLGQTGWPSWWSVDMKGETSRNKAMPGNPGKTETIENDFMEYNPTWGVSPAWNSTMHDWGDNGQNLSNANSLIVPPVGTDYTQYHTYGMLWVPASAENGWNGYRQAYFDGIPEQAVCWIGHQTYNGVFPATNDTMGSYLFSLMDQDQFQLILGSAQGGIPTMRVDYVRVYGVDKASMTVVSSDHS